MPKSRISPSNDSPESAAAPQSPFVISRASRKTRLYLAILASVVGLVAALVAALIRFQYQTNLRVWNERESSLAEDRSRMVTEWLEEQRADAQTLATRPEVIAALSKPALPETRRHSEKALGAVLETYEHAYSYVGVCVFDAAGQPVVETVAAKKLPEGLREAFGARAGAEGIGFDVVDFPDSIALSTSAPVFLKSADATERRAAGSVALVAELDRTLFSVLLRESFPTRTGETLLVRKDRDKVEYISPLRHPMAGKTTIRVPYQAPGLSARAALEGKKTFGEFVDYRGVRVLAATRRIELTGWGLIAKIDRAEALGGFRRLAWVEALAAVLLLVVFGGVLQIYRRSLVSATEKKEQQRLRALVETAAQILWTTNPLGEVEDIPAWRAFTGQTSKEVRGWGWMNALHPEDREQTTALWAEALKNRAPFNTEYRVRREDGEYRHVSSRGAPVFEPDGNIREWVGFCADIHERKRVEEERAYLASMVESSDDAIIGRSPEGIIQTWNLGAERLYGYTAQEAIGQPITLIVPPDRLDEVVTSERLGHGERIEQRETVRVGKDGRRIDVSVSISPIKDSSGRVIGAASAARDITERKRAEEALQRAGAYNRSLIEASLDPLVTINPDGKVTDVNRATEKVTGRTRAELIGTDFYDYFTDREKARAGYQQVFREGSVQDYALEVRHRDGHLTPVVYNAAVYRDERGEVVGVFAAARDISEQKRAAEALRRAGAYNRSLIEASLDPLVTIAPDGKITDVNTATEKVTGRSRRELIGTDFSDYFTDPEKARAGYQRVFREGSVQDYELEIRHREGSLTPVVYNATVYRDEGGDVVGVFAAARDITERRKAEEEIRRLNESLERRVRERTADLEAANKEMEAFTYSVSHDLRAPLRHVDGFSRLLSEEFGPQLSEEARHYLERITQGTRQMGQLIDDLLNLSRVGRAELRLQITGLGALVEEIIGELKAENPGRPIEWRVGALPYIECDPSLMKQVLANLLSNAVKFSRPRQAPVIEVGTSRQDGTEAVFVRDNGVGFSMKYADKLFGVFQRLHRPQDFEGTGVGLATVQRILQKHGGHAWGEGELNQGATFYFTLPGMRGREESKPAHAA